MVMTDSASSKAQPQVCRFASLLYTETDRIGDALIKLSDRLSSVLRTAPPCVTEENKPEELLVPLAEELRLIYSKMGDKIDQLNSIIDRLEI